MRTMNQRTPHSILNKSQFDPCLLAQYTTARAVPWAPIGSRMQLTVDEIAH